MNKFNVIFLLNVDFAILYFLIRAFLCRLRVKKSAQSDAGFQLTTKNATGQKQLIIAIH